MGLSQKQIGEISTVGGRVTLRVPADKKLKIAAKIQEVLELGTGTGFSAAAVRDESS